MSDHLVYLGSQTNDAAEQPPMNDMTVNVAHTANVSGDLWEAVKSVQNLFAANGIDERGVNRHQETD